MIIDCHAHVFQPWIGACGHPTRRIHAQYLQYMLARTVARAIRARDGAPADTKALLKDKRCGWKDLADVGLRVGRFGQMEFTVDGEDYVVQYMPTNMQSIESSPEFMIASMMYAGVDHCILQAGGAYGAMTEYNAFTQRQHPERFTGLMHVDEAMAGTPGALSEVERASRVLGLKGIYYNVDAFSRHGFPWALDDAALDPFWEKLNALKVVLCIELSSGPSYDRSGYLAHLMSLGRVLERFPELRCHLTMGPPVTFFAKDGTWDLPSEVKRVYGRDTMWVEAMFPITWGGAWDYPYPEAQALIRSFRDIFGAEKLMWGSDMPNVERFCTYAQSLDYVRRYCEFLTPREKDLILGGTCARLYGIA